MQHSGSAFNLPSPPTTQPFSYENDALGRSGRHLRAAVGLRCRRQPSFRQLLTRSFGIRCRVLATPNLRV